MKKRMIKLAGLGLLCMLMVFMAACSGGKSDNNTPKPSNSAPADQGNTEEPKTLTIAAEAWMVEKLYVQQAVDKFKAAHSDIDVKLVPYADPTVLSNFALQWGQNKSDADVVIIDGTSNAVQFLSRDLIVDFNQTNFFQGKTAKENFVGDSLSFGALGDVQFAIPTALEAYAINANKKMFAEAGLTDANGDIIPPKDWNEIYEYAKKMTKVENGKVVQQGMTIQWGPNALYTLIASEQAARGSIMNSDNVLSFDSPEIREILEIWKKGKDEGVFSIDTFTNKDAGRNNYKAGQVAMLFESGSRAPEAVPTIGDENATVIAVPGMESKGSFAFAAGIILPKASKSPKLAVQFIQEALMDGDIQSGAASTWGKLPVISDYFEMINADWKTTLFNIIDKSVTSPLYRDFPVLMKETPVQLQNYLTGASDLDSFIQNMERIISSAEKDI